MERVQTTRAGLRATAVALALSAVVHGTVAWSLRPPPKSPARPDTVRIKIVVTERAPKAPVAEAPKQPRPQPQRPVALVKAKPKVPPVTHAAPAAKPAVTAPAAKPAATPPAPGASGAATPAATGGALAATAKASYLDGVRAQIEERKVYPPVARGRHQTGRVEVGFTVLKGGEIKDARVTAPSPYTLLNDAALAAVTATGRFQPIPGAIGHDSLDILVPLVFTLNH